MSQVVKILDKLWTFLTMLFSVVTILTRTQTSDLIKKDVLLWHKLTLQFSATSATSFVVLIKNTEKLHICRSHLIWITDVVAHAQRVSNRVAFWVEAHSPSIFDKLKRKNHNFATMDPNRVTEFSWVFAIPLWIWLQNWFEKVHL